MEVVWWGEVPLTGSCCIVYWNSQVIVCCPINSWCLDLGFHDEKSIIIDTARKRMTFMLLSECVCMSLFLKLDIHGN